MKVLLSIAIVFAGLFAQADQCAYNTKTDGTSAKQLIQKNTELIDWCLNCDEMRPGLIYVATDVKINQGTNEIMVKGVFKHSKKPVTQYTNAEGWHSIDLAYTYVRTASDIFTNLSHLVGCPSEGSYTFIQTKGNAKQPHFYDAQGVRQGFTKQAMPDEGQDYGAWYKENGRKPANTKKK